MARPPATALTPGWRGALVRVRARLAARPDTEHEQALVRLVLGVLILGYLVLAAGVQQFGRPRRQFLGGQPGASCGDAGATLNPRGFDSGGFAKAEAVYAGSEGTKSLAHANSANAVSQYDIACVHFTAAHS